MFGLAYLVAFGIYLLISIGVVKWAINYARKNGKSAKRWGWGAAFIMYSLVFWDWVPTVAVQQFYCTKDSGFWVYKTLDQWKVENPGVMEGLVANKVSIQRVGDDENHTDTQTLNQRFNWVTEKHHSTFFLPVYRWTHELMDNKNGEMLSRLVDYSSGESRDYLKFWMNIRGCSSGRNNSIKFSEVANQFKGAKK